MADDIRDSRFRYVDANDLENRNIDFADLDVRNDQSEKLGEVDGFIVDASSDRPYYVVVESGGWFSSGRYLVPINHARLEHDGKNDEDVLRVNLDKDTIRRYPRFDMDEFARLSEPEMRDFEDTIQRACCPRESVSETAASRYVAWEHYHQPAWWDRSVRATASERRVPADRVATATIPEARPTPERHDRERIVARESQPAGDRAEPGDVLGIESGGEETHLGDTARDERRRVDIADREARKAEKNNRG